MKLAYGFDEQVAAWVAQRIPHVAGGTFGQSVAIGVLDGKALIAGVVFHDWQPAFKTMQVSMAAISPRWARRGTILALLSYPFDEVGIEKLWSAMPMKNERAIRFNLGIGFTREAILSRHFGKDHAIITRLFYKDYLKLKRKWGVKDASIVRAA